MVFDDPPSYQLNENFITTLDNMYVSRSVVLGVDYYIVSVSLPVQYSDHDASNEEYNLAKFKLSIRLINRCYIASKPPSSTSACPVTKDEASEQSQSTASAISSGRPNRPSGIALVMIEAIIGLPCIAPWTIAVSV